jgi:hypothetical protein
MSSNIVDEIVIRIRADLEKFKGEIIAANGSLKKFEDSTKSAGVSTQKLDAGLKAFSWNTFAQGALNTSTAMAQLYTSISNIAKIQYTVKAAIIGVERAEDLLQRKTLQLTKEIEKNGALSRNAILLRNELATATEDLAVKNERVKIAQDAVNDTYILFTSNVINTVFGTMQTLVGLKAMLVMKAAATTTATKLETTAHVENTAAMRIESAVTKQLAAEKFVLSGAVANLTAQTKLNTSFTTNLAGKLSKLSGTTVGITAALFALSAGLAKTGYDMDAMDGKVDGVYTRFHNAKTAVDSFGRQLDVVIDKGDALEQLGHNLLQTMTLGVYQAPDLSKLTKESMEKLKKELGPIFGEALSDSMTSDEFLKAFSTALSDKQIAQSIHKEMREFRSIFSDIASGEEITLDLSEKHLTVINDIYKGTVDRAFEHFETMQLVNGAYNDINKSAEYGLKLLEDYGFLTEQNKSLIKDNLMIKLQELTTEKQINDTKKMGFEQEMKYLREIADLKKKQDPISQKRSLFSGILGLEEDFLEGQFGKEIASHLGYQPFMGVISKRNNEVKMMTDLIRLDNQLYGYTNMLEQLMVILPGVSDPAQRKQITDTIIALRDNISNVKSLAGPSISSSNKMIAGFARQYTQAIGQLQNNLRSLVSHGFGSFPTFGGQDRLSQYYTNQMRSITGGAGALARSMAERTVVNRNTILASIRGVNTSRIGSVQRTTVSVPGYGDGTLSVRRRGGKGAARTRQESINMANMQYSANLESMTGYTLTELEKLTGLNLSYVDFNTLFLRNPRSNRFGNIEAFETQRALKVNEYIQQLERNRAEVSSRISLITELSSINPYLSISIGQGSTQLSSILQEQENLLQLVGLSKTQAKEIVVTPTRGRTEIDDRIRWTQRLEQISTGATVF